MSSAGVVAHAPREDISPADELVGKDFLSLRTSRFRVALNDSASELSALASTAPIDWVTLSLWQVA